MRKAAVRATLAILGVSSVVLPAGAAPSRQADTAVLEADRVVLRSLAPGDEHRYQLVMKAGEFAQVIVEQLGIDVVVTVRDSENKPVDEFQDEIRPRGEEQVEVVAGRAGGYTLTIAPAEGIVASGTYAIRVAGRRAATDADRAMQQSRTFRSTAQRLERSGEIRPGAPVLRARPSDRRRPPRARRPRTSR